MGREPSTLPGPVLAGGGLKDQDRRIPIVIDAEWLKENLSRTLNIIDRSPILKLIDKVILKRSIYDIINRGGFSRVAELIPLCGATHSTIEIHRDMLVAAGLLKKGRGPMRGRRYVSPGDEFETFMLNKGRMYDNQGREIMNIKVFYRPKDVQSTPENQVLKRPLTPENQAHIYIKEEKESKDPSGHIASGDSPKLEKPVFADSKEPATYSTYATSAKEYQDNLLSDFSDEAGALFEIWNDPDSVLKKVIVNRTQVFYETMQAIETKLSQGWKAEEIGRAIINYNWLWSLPSLKLQRTAQTHYVKLGQFFGFNRFVKIGNSKLIADIESWFDECVKGQSYLLSRYAAGVQKDEHPEVTKVIREQWDRSYRSGDLSISDERNFRTCAKKVVKFVNDHEEKLNISGVYFDHPERFVEKYLFPALKAASNGRQPLEVSTVWLANDIMFNRQLPLYLIKIGLLKGDIRRRDDDD